MNLPYSALGTLVFKEIHINNARTNLIESHTSNTLDMKTDTTRISLHNNDNIINVHNAIISNARVPQNGNDIATKAYVDGVSAGVNTLSSAQLGTTEPLPANTYYPGMQGIDATLTGMVYGLLYVDGIPVQLGDRILVKDEASMRYNGVYNVSSTGGPTSSYILTRVTDFNNTNNVQYKAYCKVIGGATNSNKGFIMVTSGTIIVGNDDIEWEETGIAQTTYLGSNSIDITNNIVAVNTGSLTSLTIDANGLHISPSSTSGDILRYDANDSTHEPTYGVNIGNDNKLLTINPMASMYDGSSNNEHIGGGIELSTPYIDNYYSQGIYFGPVSSNDTLRTIASKSNGQTYMYHQRKVNGDWQTIYITG